MHRNILLNLSRFFLAAAFFCSILASFFAAFLILSLIFYILYAVQERLPLPKLNFLDFLPPLFLAVSLISAFFAGDKTSAFAGSLVFLGYNTAYFYFRLMDLDSRTYHTLILGAAASILFWCVFALVHYFVFPVEIKIMSGNQVLFQCLPYDYTGRLESVFQIGSLGANVLAFSLVFPMAYYFRNPFGMKLPERLLYIAAILAAFTVIALTATRGAFIFVGLVLIIAIFLTRKWHYFLFAAVLGALLFLIPVTRNKLAETLRNPAKEVNIVNRLHQYKAGWKIFKNGNVALGTGLLNFRPQYEKLYASDFAESKEDLQKGKVPHVPYIHNNYLSVLVETGLAGFLALFSFFIVAFISLIRKGFRFTSVHILTAFLMLCGFLVHSLLDAVLWVSPIALFLWIALALGLKECSGPDKSVKEV